MMLFKSILLMNNFNDQFYALLEQNNNNNNNLIELLKLCKYPGIKIDIDTKIVYITEIVYQYYDSASKYEKEQINILLKFIEKQLKFTDISSKVFEDCLFYKQQIEYLEYYENFEDERQCIIGYSCGYYECEGFDEYFY